MKLLELGWRNYRNLAEFHLRPNARFNIFAGANAQGKTNILEAIYVLARLKSFRTSTMGETVRFGQAGARLFAKIEGPSREQSLAMDIKGNRRRVELDGESLRRLSDCLGTLRVVIFTPEDVTLFRGSPSQRRNWLDHAVFSTRSAYLELLGEYTKVLKQRNKLLKDDNPDPLMLDVYTEQLLDLGSEVARQRLEYLRLAHPEFRRGFDEIFGDTVGSDGRGRRLAVELMYKPSWRRSPSGDRDEIVLGSSQLGDRGGDVGETGRGTPEGESFEEIRASFAETLRRRRGLELRRGTTMAGPHRDDLEAWLEGRPASTHASQGQHRSLVLALKIAEIRLLENRFRVEPLLLLDDVSSELDHNRSRQLFEFLSGFEGQVFITTTSASYIELRGVGVGERSTWEIEGGTLSPISTDPEGRELTRDPSERS